MKNVLILFVFIIAIQGIFAGISPVYWEKNPLEMHLGETKDIQIGLTSKEDAFIRLTISEGGEFAEIIDKENIYFIEGGNGVFANLRVSIPRNLKVGEMRKIVLNAKTETNEKSEGVGLTQSISTEIPIKIIKKQFNVVHALVLGLVALAIIFLEIKKKH